MRVIYKDNIANSDSDKGLQAVVLEKVELKFQDLSVLLPLLPLVDNQNSKSDVENTFHEILKPTVHLK